MKDTIVSMKDKNWSICRIHSIKVSVSKIALVIKYKIIDDV